MSLLIGYSPKKNKRENILQTYRFSELFMRSYQVSAVYANVGKSTFGHIFKKSKITYLKTTERMK